MKNKKIAFIIPLAVCACIALYSIFSMSNSSMITPYVSFKNAMETGARVQIIGKVNAPKTVSYNGGDFAFTINEKGGVLMNVVCSCIKPANFENADQVVLHGIYNKKKAIFEAEKILVKCPSKYKRAK